MLFEDLHWKFLALVAASVIWFIGMNMSDPYINLSVAQRLRLDNLDIMVREGVLVINEDLLREINVTVTLRARRSDMDKLQAAVADADPRRFAEFVEVSVDFRAVDSAAADEADGVSRQRLRVSPNLQSGFEHMSISPPYVDVYLDMFASRLFNVQTIQLGETMPGFELQHIRLGNSNVTVSGSRSDLRMASRVQAYVDISGVHDDAELPVALTVLNNYAENMTERVHLNVTETTAFVRVWQVRPVDVIVSGAGTPADGFALAGITPDRVSIEIVGPSEMLEDIGEIFAEVDLSGGRSNATKTVLLEDWLPDGVSLKQGEISQFEVSARIEPIEERTFVVPRGNVRSRGVVGLYQLVDDNANIRVTVRGPRSIIATLDSAQIEPEFDLRGRAIGVHTVPLMVELPPGLTLVGRAPTLMVQIHQPAAASSEEDEHEPIESPEPMQPTPPPEPLIEPVLDELPPQAPEYVDEYRRDYHNPYHPYSLYEQPQGADDEEYIPVPIYVEEDEEV